MGVFHYSPMKGRKFGFVHFTTPWQAGLINRIFEGTDWLEADGEQTIWGNGVFILRDMTSGSFVILTAPGDKYYQ